MSFCSADAREGRTRDIWWRRHADPARFAKCRGAPSRRRPRHVAAAAQAAPVKLVALGDSLTAGLGLPASQSFPAKLEAALKARGHDVTIVNAGVSGDTASDGLARVDWSVGDDAKAVIVELGANDALRGVDPATTRAALDKILQRLDERHLPVLLAGMLAPRNFGEDYAERFDAIYPDLAGKAWGRCSIRSSSMGSRREAATLRPTGWWHRPACFRPTGCIRTPPGST